MACLFHQQRRRRQENEDDDERTGEGGVQRNARHALRGVEQEVLAADVLDGFGDPRQERLQVGEDRPRLLAHKSPG